VRETQISDTVLRIDYASKAARGVGLRLAADPIRSDPIRRLGA